MVTHGKDAPWGWIVRSIGVLLFAVTAHAGVDLKAHRVPADDGLALRVWEKSSVQPASSLLLVHGRTWSSRPDFDLQTPGRADSLMDGLVDRNMRALAVDLRGYGESPRDSSGWLTPARAAADVISVLEWINGDSSRLGDKPYLFGWSYGSLVSLKVAQMRPDLIAGLILFGYPKRPGFDVDPPGADGLPPRAPTTATAAASDFIQPEAVAPETVQAFVAAALASDPVRADWRALAEWREIDPAEIELPVLLLEGFRDPIALDEEQAALFSGLRSDDKAWVVIPGGSHVAFLERPRAYFIDTIDRFVHRPND